MTPEEKLKRIVDDPILWIETFCKIVDKNTKLVPFILTPEQRELLENLGSRNIVLKSRQLGVTYASCGMSLYYALTRPNTTCFLMAHTVDASTNIFDKLKQLYNDLPKAVKLKNVAYNKKELKFVNGSRIIVATCGSKDQARGLTITYCHISEIAFMSDKIERQLLAISEAMTPNGKLIIESTANGMNYFTELWNRAENKESTYRPFFFNWINGKATFLDAYKEDSERYVYNHGRLPTYKELDDKEKALFNKGATIEQLIWRRYKIMDTSEEQFMQEFPSDPLEAWLSTGSNVFSTSAIMERLDNLHHNKPITHDDYKADDEDIFECDEDDDAEYFDDDDILGEEKRTKSLSELPDTLIPYIGNCLTVWRLPTVGEHYYIGVDCSEGLGSKNDASTIEVIDDEGYQCLEFRSNKIKSYQMAQIVYDIGMFYNCGLLIVERASAGHSVLDKLYNDYQYYNLYKHKSYDRKGKKKSRIGFDSNQITKPLMIRAFQELFETNKVFVNSKDLLMEMKTFQFDGGSYNAMSGFHDDLITSICLAIAGLQSGKYYKL